jgi:fatty acid desaturase
MESGNDYSAGYSVLRENLTAETQGAYRQFLKSLVPDYKKVWRDLALGYGMLIALLYLVNLNHSIIWLVFSIPLGAILIGYWIAYLQLFIHEGAHYNLAPGREMNDRLCDLLICWMVGTRIKDYRRTHFQHHRKLGHRDDTERSYFNRLSNTFLLNLILGIYPVRVFLQRRASRKEMASGDPADKKEIKPLLTGILVHLALILGLVAAGAWPSALAWISGMGACFPFFGAMRQLLEHRSEEADPAADYAQTDHGAVTRLFGNDFFSRTFGGAGFNRHLLHHWEPAISYTRLGDLEDYLMKTSIAPIIESRRSSYMKVFMGLYKNDNRA